MMCAGVQNVSRPIDMCHEISQGPPIIPLTTPVTMHQIVHGTDSTFAPTPARTPTATGGLAMCCPKGIDCPMASNSPAATTSGIFPALPRVYTPSLNLQTNRRQALPQPRATSYSDLRTHSQFISASAELNGTSTNFFRLYHRGVLPSTNASPGKAL